MQALRLLLLTLLLYPALPALPTVAQEPKQVLIDIQKAYQNVASLDAVFQQEVKQVAFGRTYTASGRIRYASGKIRWDYQSPDPQTYVVADNFVYWVQPSEHQIVQMQLGEAFESHHAVAALLGGMSELGKYFKPVSSSSLGQRHLLKVHPKFDNPQVSEVLIEFDPKAKLVRVVEISDAFGNQNRIMLNDINKTAVVSQSVFVVNKIPGYKLSRFGQ